MQKLDVKDVAGVSGGDLSLMLNNLLNAIIRGFWTSLVRNGAGFEAGFDAFMISSLTAIAGNVISSIVSKYNAYVAPKKEEKLCIKKC